MRGHVFTASEKLVTETCYSCGVLFAMAEGFKEHRVDDKKSFYCPNGHAQHYTGKTEVEKEKERADALERQLASARGNILYYQERIDSEKRQHAATKGKLTKVKKRIANGVCPECNRHFANVEKHMQTQHPTHAQEENSGSV